MPTRRDAVTALLAAAVFLLVLPLLFGGRVRFDESVLCAPEHRAWHRWGTPGAESFGGPIVPESEVWEVTAAGVAVKVRDDGSYDGGEFMMQKEVLTPQGECCWYVPIARTAGGVVGTPVLALTQDVELRPGESISARANAAMGTARLGLLLEYDAYSLECRR